MVNNGDIDIGITSLKDVSHNINYKVFAKFERFLIASKEHPLSKMGNINLKDVIKYALLLPPKGSNTRTIIDHEFGQRGLEYKTAMEITGKAAIKTYVGMNLGVAIINGFYLSKGDRKTLICKNMGKYFGKAERGLLTRKNKYLSFHAKEFIKIMCQEFKLT